MYLLVSLTDVIQIHPSDFDKRSARAIEDLINRKYADKVLAKVGLCVAFHSIIATSEGLIGHGSGMVNVNVDFRMIVHRPFKGEIIHATITSSNIQDGIHLSQDFFEDIVVPPETLFDSTKFKSDENGTEAFVWIPDGEAEYWFDKAEPCMVRVEEEIWRDISPHAETYGNLVTEENVEQEKKVPYLIRGSMMHSGLGPTLWWVDPEQQ